MIIFRPESVKTMVFINPNDAPGILSIIGQFPELSHAGRLRPWVLHAPGAMMTVVNTNSLKPLTGQAMLGILVFVASWKD